MDLYDQFPLDSTEVTDADLDGTGDNADPDDDNDGVNDELDAFPLDSSESKDTDNDGVGDNSDAFPSDASESLDSDSEVGDNGDNCPSLANSDQLNTDGDLKVTLVIQTMTTMVLQTTKKNLMALTPKAVSPADQAASALT